MSSDLCSFYCPWTQRPAGVARAAFQLSSRNQLEPEFRPHGCSGCPQGQGHFVGGPHSLFVHWTYFCNSYPTSSHSRDCLSKSPFCIFPKLSGLSLNIWAQRMLVDTSGLNLSRSRSLLDHLPFDLGVLGLGSPSGGLWAFWPVYSLSSTPMGPKM